MKKAILLALGAAFSAVAIAGCGDNPYSYRPGLLVQVDTFTVYALNGTPPSYPSAVNVAAIASSADSTGILAPAAVPSSGGSSFDFAVDLTAGGAVTAYPAPLVVRGLTNRRVGLQRIASTFDAVTQAPTTGYSYDSVAVTLGTGDVLLVQAQRAFQGERCFSRQVYGYDPVLYAKGQVISVNTAERSVRMRFVLNPNCGFRGLKPGSISGN